MYEICMVWAHLRERWGGREEGRSTPVRSQGALEGKLSQWITQELAVLCSLRGSWETISTATGLPFSFLISHLSRALLITSLLPQTADNSVCVCGSIAQQWSKYVRVFIHLFVHAMVYAKHSWRCSACEPECMCASVLKYLTVQQMQISCVSHSRPFQAIAPLTRGGGGNEGQLRYRSLRPDAQTCY